MQRRRLASAILACLVALSACVSAEAPRVGLKQHAADIVFGIPSLESAAPANVAPPGEGSVLMSAGVRDTARQVRPGLPSKPCPDAEFNTVDREAPTMVDGVPAAGRYRWKAGGDYALAGLARRIPIGPFETREVQDARPLERKGESTFTTLQREAATGDAVTSVFEVAIDRPDLADGIYLVRVLRRRQTPSGQRTAAFRPQPPILYLPLPVTIASDVSVPYTGVYSTTEFSSSGVDPDTLESMSLRGRPIQRRGVDACGKMVDSIYVESELTFTSGSTDPGVPNPGGGASRRVKYNFGVATQLGGLLVLEQVQSPCGTYNQSTQRCEPEPQVRYEANLGQLSPDPA